MSDEFKLDSLMGIPVVINPMIPKDEIWMVTEGKKSTIIAHEGPHTGEEVEVWLRRPNVHRIINIGDMTEIRPPKFRFKGELFPFKK
jgi:hypothetical protein